MMRLSTRAREFIGIVVLALIIVATTLESLRLSGPASRAPLLLMTILIVLLIAHTQRVTHRTFVKLESPSPGAAVASPGQAEDAVDGQDTANKKRLASSLAVTGWFLLVFFLFVVGGLLFASFAFTIAYMRFHGGEAWLRSFIAGLALFGLVYLLLATLLRIPIYDGMLQ